MVVTRSQAAGRANFQHCALDDLRALRRKLRKGKFVLERETDPAILELVSDGEEELFPPVEPSQEEVPRSPSTNLVDYERPDHLAGPGPATAEVRASLLQQDFELYDSLFYESLAQDWERHNNWLDLVRSREVVQDVSPVEDREMSCVNDELFVAQQQALLDDCVIYESTSGFEQQVALDVFKQRQELAEVFDEDNPFAGMSTEEMEQQLALLGNWM